MTAVVMSAWVIAGASDGAVSFEENLCITIRVEAMSSIRQLLADLQKVVDFSIEYDV